jgi:hypothetical protein
VACPRSLHLSSHPSSCPPAPSRLQTRHAPLTIHLRDGQGNGRSTSKAVVRLRGDGSWGRAFVRRHGCLLFDFVWPFRIVVGIWRRHEVRRWSFPVIAGFLRRREVSQVRGWVFLAGLPPPSCGSTRWRWVGCDSTRGWVGWLWVHPAFVWPDTSSAREVGGGWLVWECWRWRFERSALA